LELFIVSVLLSVWFGIKLYRNKNKHKSAAKQIQTIWQKQQFLYREVLRKRLAQLYNVEGEILADMVDAVVQREDQLIDQLTHCLHDPGTDQLSHLLQHINRHGDVYLQLSNKKS
jgi:hypothetical protein